jgi:osmotically inducible protein OsmC
MAIRTSEAEWRGDLKGEQGEVKLGSGGFSGSYSFHSRFENSQGTNPKS